MAIVFFQTKPKVPNYLPVQIILLLPDFERKSITQKIFVSLNVQKTAGLMVNIQKQIDYWINGADDDIITADLLIREKRNLHGLFFCHLVIEKAIKANLVKKTGDVAPRTHNLVYLSEIQDWYLMMKTRSL